MIFNRSLLFVIINLNNKLERFNHIMMKKDQCQLYLKMHTKIV